MESDIDTQELSSSGLNPFQAMPNKARAWVYFLNVVAGLLLVYLAAKGAWGIGKDELAIYAGLQPFVSLTSLSNVSVGP